MKKLYYLIVLALILGLVLTGCFLSNVGQVPTSEQSGISYLTKSPGPDLIGLWHFDTDANDSSSNGNHGTISGASLAPGKFGNALSFNGIDDYVDLGNNVFSNADLVTYTFEAWIKIASLDGVERRIFDDEGGLRPDLSLDNKLRAVHYDGTVRMVEWDTAPSVDTWYHVVQSYDGSYLRLYINGNEVGTPISCGVWTPDSHVRAVRIGASWHPTSERHWNGLIDEVRIWDTATPSFNLNVEPQMAFNPVNTKHTVTATVTIGGTEPAPGVLVDFTVSGVNGDMDSVLTDSNGQATFTYTGTNAGEDTIRAEINEAPYAQVSDQVTKYWLENFVTGGGKINMSTLEQNGGGKKAALTFAGTVGVLEGEGIVGQFQIVDHIGLFYDGKGAESWHCNNFTYLEFSGDSAESPEASHDTAIFEGEFNSNRGGTEMVRLRIIDNGEPGAGNDTFSIYFIDWVEWTIDGGNFQVHDIED